jgi:hypothetical protein
MKKRVFVLSMILILVLSACASASTQETVVETVGESAERGLTLNQLAFGIFAMEETDSAVTSEQAEILLPLWKAAKAVYESDTASQTEREAITQQIESAMSAGQMTFISQMEDDPNAMRDWMAEQGLEMGNFAGGELPDGLSKDDITPEMRESMRQGMGQVNGGPGGGPGGMPGGGVMLMGDDGEIPEAIREKVNGTGGMFNTILFEQVIILLEEKISAE